VKELERYALNLDAADQQIRDLEALLSPCEPIGERALLDFFRNRQHLIGLAGKLILGTSRPNRIGSEVDLLGSFRTDFVVGDDTRGQYLFVEFESAENVVFKKRGPRSKRDWHDRLNVGHAQLLDWQWLLHENDGSELRDQFPNRKGIKFLLVIGRDHYLEGAQERRRFEWRAENIHVKGAKMALLTFDGLLSLIREEAKSIRDYAAQK
jgi:hypothetical protein